MATNDCEHSYEERQKYMQELNREMSSSKSREF